MEILEQIQQRTQAVLRELIPSGRKVALLDFPNHKNAGDHLIFAGEMEHLSRLGVDVAYVADATRYRKKDLDHYIGGNGIILIHGGGNFGDRWGEAQSFHNRIVAENHDHPVIQLSQGIEFSDGPILSQVQEIYGAHPELTLLIRDSIGVEDARARFNKNDVLFCPDMAFGNRLVAARSQRRSVVYLHRTDSELVPVNAVHLPKSIDHTVVDWHLNRREELVWKVLHLPGALGRRLPFLLRPLYPLQRRVYFAIARLNLGAAKRILDSGNVVLTDRLHAAVLGALMGKDVVALDNANGKVKAIINDYLGHFSNVTFADNANIALERVLQIQGAD